MAELSQDDLTEQILLRSEVKDLIRFKSVRKSWRALITSPRFINRHLNHNYNKDRYNNELSNRRITLVAADVSSPSNYYLVGSSNGLVCLISDHFNREVLVGNPLTREVRQLTPYSYLIHSVCRGFGYDSSKDDYKVIVGALKSRNQTCFHVLSLKSNMWRVVGEVTGKFIRQDGILCNGALHWITSDNGDENNMKNIKIIAYDLSREEFREIPQPDDARYEFTYDSCMVVIEECLCIYVRGFSFVDVWLMKDYNVKESWELRRYNQEMKFDIVHYLRAANEYQKALSDSCIRADASRLNRTLGYIDAPVFVQSLVSPGVNVKPKREKRSAKQVLPDANERPKRNTRRSKLNKGRCCCRSEDDRMFRFSVNGQR